MTWTADKLDTMERMWNAGKTALAISKVIDKSRSAVLGKANRDKVRFKPRIKPSAPKAPSARKSGETSQALTTPRKSPRKRPAAKKTVSLPAVQDVSVRRRTGQSLHEYGIEEAEAKFRAAEGRRVAAFTARPGTDPIAFMEVNDGQCKWPVEAWNKVSESDMPCCGSKTRGRTVPYCEYHEAIAAGRVK